MVKCTGFAALMAGATDMKVDVASCRRGPTMTEAFD